MGSAHSHGRRPRPLVAPVVNVGVLARPTGREPPQRQPPAGGGPSRGWPTHTPGGGTAMEPNWEIHGLGGHKQADIWKGRVSPVGGEPVAEIYKDEIFVDNHKVGTIYP